MNHGQAYLLLPSFFIISDHKYSGLPGEKTLRMIGAINNATPASAIFCTFSESGACYVHNGNIAAAA
ncbi:hypothetical protein [Erwinia sp. B116]|uniref:hypothetical protein n=1 Tax=Erwinia sp. B116 TaxID=1561024 RepID=UPI00130443F8|nr:hypothetical protein [Erwinia sp. B116]